MDKKLHGLHHVTAITSDIEKNYKFFTEVLGIRLVKKTVNQDDIDTYHTYFGDDKGSAGTVITFFDFANIGQGTHGTEEVHRMSFRVANDEVLDYWIKRFDRLGVEHDGIKERFGKKYLKFRDFDDQRYQMISDGKEKYITNGTPWDGSPVPNEYQFLGLGPIILRVKKIVSMDTILTKVFNMNQIAQENDQYLYQINDEGGYGEVIVIEDSRDDIGMQGYGTIHHVAFMVETQEDLEEWIQWFDQLRIPNSGLVDRYYFKSNYLRVAPTILFELATNGPGFAQDEDLAHLGEILSLPPFLEGERAQIEDHVRPFDTMRHNKGYEKEYE